MQLAAKQQVWTIQAIAALSLLFVHVRTCAFIIILLCARYPSVYANNFVFDFDQVQSI